MSKRLTIADALALSPAERIQLVEEIWDSLAEESESIPLTDAQRRELDARLSAHRRDPHAVVPWAEVKKRLDQST